ncbi:MAG: hypothetical protein LUC85_02235 [Bacteroidales bacterium]|nr:hypothetical protein [Bacteroidales bacterium]
MKEIRYIILSIAILAGLSAVAQENRQYIARTDTIHGQFIPAGLDPSVLDEKVLVHGDTVSIIIPERNYGRYHRGLYNFLFIPRGSWSVGLTASYGSLNSDDISFFKVVDNFDFDGKRYSIKPSISYFFRNNQSIGLKFNYTKGEADLGSLKVDIDDINFDVHDVSYYTQTYSAAVFYRNYVGLGREKRFAIFNDVDLQFGAGSARFKRYYNGELSDTKTKITEVALSFSPGVCVFIVDQVSFNVSFGVFGVTMRHEKQRTNGEYDGSRFSSGANFKFNIFNINFGMGVVF